MFRRFPPSLLKILYLCLQEKVIIWVYLGKERGKCGNFPTSNFIPSTWIQNYDFRQYQQTLMLWIVNLKSLITIFFFFLIGKDTKKCILGKTGHPMANPKAYKRYTTGAYRQKNKRKRCTKDSPALIYGPTTQKS